MSPSIPATMFSETTQVESLLKKMTAQKIILQAHFRLSVMATGVDRATTSGGTPGAPPGASKATSRSVWLRAGVSAASTDPSTGTQSDEEALKAP